jgi:hypothetical protein
MANTIAYTSGNSLTGSLKSGVISINLNDQIIGQNYNWRNGIVFSNQYIIYSDTFTQGIDTEANAKPCAWACDYNDVALLNLINSLPPLIGQPKYATLASAITWLQGQNKYFIVNQNYPTIVTDGLTVLLDPSLTGSYPVVGTTFYDVSGNGYNAALVNSPAWSNSGTTSFFNFDGTDDFIRVASNSSILSNTTYTKVVWFNASSFALSNNIISGGSDGAHAFWLAGGNRLNSGHNGLWSTVQSSTVLSLNRWYFGAVTFNTTTGWVLYLNGNQEDTDGSTTTFTGNGNIQIGSYGEANLFVGKIGRGMIYNRVLSSSEVLQNYYQGPIVTSGIVAAYDSGNIVSYPGTSTTWYDMVGSNNATLLNGITYNLNQGGVLNFDGTDDSASIAYNSALDPTGGITLEAWVKPFNIANSTFVEIYRKETGSARQLFSFQDGGTILSFGTGTAGGYDELDVSINASDYNGQWVHLVASYTSGFKAIYRNGVLIGSATNVTGNLLQSTGTSYIGSIGGSGEFFFGEYAIFRMYNRGLNATEVLQNYSAQRNRFQTNQAFANGGTVSTVIENGINYRVHTFTSSGTLTVLSAGIVEVLSVAGGGGGSGNFYDDGAGGGGGGLIYNTDYTVTTGNKTVTVGSGGVASSGGAGGNGNNSVFDNLTAIGGGGGAPHRSPGVSGGSGGGGGGSFVGDGQSNAGGSALQPGSASGGKGNRGGNGGIGDVISGGGGYPGSAGGGGAGQQGFPPTGGGTNEGGKGGDGAQISINGTPTYYAGGGGGVRNGVGGLGGGGTASYGRDGSPAGGGGVNTGGGGGGGRAFTGETGVPGPGGSGIVIVRYRI